MVTFRHNGKFARTEKFLRGAAKINFRTILEACGKEGVRALSSATPSDSGKTAESWGYEIQKTKNNISLIWTNSNDAGGVSVAVLLQYGHATRNGGFVEGRDYINPAIRPIFDKISKELSEEVAKL